ncbi:hypothetical protein [Inquilinus sp. CAU 1745]|uniref:hypothetical protein n=1 Tax=Inquilinus sp. CAU 1745 TaxID=3140369 RepID=UPI00325B220E
MSDAVTLGDALRLARRNAALLAICAISCCALAFLWLRVTPPVYEASLIVAPADPVGLDAAARPRADMSALTGLLLPDRNDASEFDRFLELLTSADVAAGVMEDEALTRRLLSDSWDEETNRWRPPAGVSAWFGRLGARLLGRPGWEPPVADDLARRVDRSLRVERVDSTAMRRLVFRHADAETARAALAALVDAADRLLREAADRRVEARIAYLGDQLSRTLLSEHRLALSNLLARQERRRMMVRSGMPYAAIPVGSIAAPRRPAAPNAPLTLLAGLVFGLALGGVVAVARGGTSR